MAGTAGLWPDKKRNNLGDGEAEVEGRGNIVSGSQSGQISSENRV